MQDTNGNVIWRMRITCWNTNARLQTHKQKHKDTQTKHLSHTFVQLKQRIFQRASVLSLLNICSSEHLSSYFHCSSSTDTAGGFVGLIYKDSK